MKIKMIGFLGLLCIVSLTSAKGLQTADPSEVDADYAIQGEYSGTLGDGDYKLGIQVIALGKGKFRAVVYHGGLPGDGWNGEEKNVAEAESKNGVVFFEGDQGTATLKNGEITIHANGQEVGTLNRIVRESATLGAKPPSGAIVLFDGTSTDNWVGAGGGEATMSGGLLHQGANTKRTFQDCEMHIEFRLPYAPEARGQARGNSGLYLQGRYECQMLDSFGLEGEQNECGGVYEIAKPNVNMCFPPLQWQTYDVDFRAAKYDKSGKKTQNATMTVRHNGVVIHKDLELPKSTRAAPLAEGPDPGFMHLQNHGNPVRYRNIWIVEK